jgi:hypothetical protein
MESIFSTLPITSELLHSIGFATSNKQMPESGVRSINTMKQYIRSIHKIQSEIGGGEQGVFASRETNYVIEEVIKILGVPVEPTTTRYECEEEDKENEEDMIFIPARWLIPVFNPLLTKHLAAL